jgi:hypothetical protein
MGICPSWEVDPPVDTPPQENQDVRRQRAAEAAMQRQKESESRGLKDPQRVKEKQAKREALDKAMSQAGQGENKLSWQVGP